MTRRWSRSLRFAALDKYETTPTPYERRTRAEIHNQAVLYMTLTAVDLGIDQAICRRKIQATTTYHRTPAVEDRQMT